MLTSCTERERESESPRPREREAGRELPRNADINDSACCLYLSHANSRCQEAYARQPRCRNDISCLYSIHWNAARAHPASCNFAAAGGPGRQPPIFTVKAL